MMHLLAVVLTIHLISKTLVCKTRRRTVQLYRKPRQSCRRADPTHAGSVTDDRVTLTFDLLTSGSTIACRATAVHSTSTKFGVDSSSRFPLERGHRHTQKSLTPLITLPTQGLLPAWVDLTYNVIGWTDGAWGEAPIAPPQNVHL